MEYIVYGTLLSTDHTALCFVILLRKVFLLKVDRWNL